MSSLLEINMRKPNVVFSDRKAYSKTYEQRPEVKARRRAFLEKYRQTPQYKDWEKKYSQKPDVIARRRAYQQRLDVKERKREYRHRPEVRSHIRLKQREYAKKPHVKECKRIYRQMHVLGTTINGERARFLAVTKRTRSHSCEFCSKQTEQLHYHHWRIVERKVFGIWVCASCHMFLNGVERGFNASDIERYFLLKQKIDQEFCVISKL